MSATHDQRAVSSSVSAQHGRSCNASLDAQGSIRLRDALARAPLTGAGRVGEAIPEGGLCGDACRAVALLGVRSCSVKDSPARQHTTASHLPLLAEGQGVALTSAAGNDAGSTGVESLQDGCEDSESGRASCGNVR